MGCPCAWWAKHKRALGEHLNIRCFYLLVLGLAAVMCYIYKKIKSALWQENNCERVNLFNQVQMNIMHIFLQDQLFRTMEN